MLHLNKLSKVIRLNFVFFAICVCSVFTSASAQSRASSSTPHFCSTFPTYDEESLIPFLDAMIIPGERLSLDRLMKTMPPETMSRIVGLDEARADQEARDWPNLCRYNIQNSKIVYRGTRPDVVFLGDSITEIWARGDASLFNDVSLNRGISGQTTGQMLLRFYQDVILLNPRMVHIMAGTNDIAPEATSASDIVIVNNIRAMIDIAKANGIRVIIASITPSKGFYMQPDFDPSIRIASINRKLVQLAAEQQVTYIDYFPELVDHAGDIKAELSNDGLHPNRNGYAVMRPLAEQAIKREMRK